MEAFANHSNVTEDFHLPWHYRSLLSGYAI